MNLKNQQLHILEMQLLTAPSLAVLVLKLGITETNVFVLSSTQGNTEIHWHFTCFFSLPYISKGDI